MLTENLYEYKCYLIEEERSHATIEKYLRDIKGFLIFLNNQEITKEILIQYKEELLKNHKATSVNSMLVAIHGFLDYLNLSQCKVKLYKIQRKIFIEEEKELTRKEYERLLKTANHKNNEKLYLIMQTICATGIRVSEHRYITVESIKNGHVTIQNKGKIRDIIIPKKLKRILLTYCKKQNIQQGSIFITRNGNPMNRSNIWAMMKSLCKEAGVDEGKVYPHNLRHLFAFTFYAIEKNLAYLADILGHSSIETTRIYTKTSLKRCQDTIDKMNLIHRYLLC